MTLVILPTAVNQQLTGTRTSTGDIALPTQVEKELQSQFVMQAKIAQSDELFRLLVANVRDYAIFMLDPTGHITTWNIGAQRIKGYTADEVVGRHFSVFYPEEDARAGICDQKLELAARDGRLEEEGWRVRGDGNRFWAHTSITAVRDDEGTLIGFAKITRDLTDRKRIEDERAARLAAEQANRSKDAFLATLGHELRNPLAPIMTALQLTKLHPDTYPTRELQIIERQVQQITHLVDELLDVSRIAQGKLELRKQIVDLREAIAKAIEIASPLMEQKGHRFELEVPSDALLVDGDTPRLTQVFTNLICNAAKYTQAGGHITVLVSRTEGHIVAEVHDDGCGIDEELLARIFEPFVQGPQQTDQTAGGLGLGLPLVRSLVELHGGTVDAHSPGPRMGSTFTVQLPSAPGTTRRARKRTQSAVFPIRPVSTHRILVVDDNDDARMLLADVLAELGHEVSTADSGRAALESVRTFTPEIAILDIGLPDMDGYELATELRRVLRDIRLIALSGYGQPNDRARSQSAGFDRHLVKPVEMRRLQQTIAEVASAGSVVIA